LVSSLGQWQMNVHNCKKKLHFLVKVLPSTATVLPAHMPPPRSATPIPVKNEIPVADVKVEAAAAVPSTSTALNQEMFYETTPTRGVRRMAMMERLQNTRPNILVKIAAW
jgi:hypothetical protein